MTDKQMFKALVMVELFDSEEEEETKGRGMTRSWLKKREQLGYFTNILREMQLEDTEGFKEMIRMDFKHFNEILNLIAPDITPQEIIGENKVFFSCRTLDCDTYVFAYWRNVSVIEFSIPYF